MQNQFFEGRTIKPYLDAVRPADLVVGRTYFRVFFVEKDMVVPEIIALVFLGRDLNPRLPGLYFQDAASYFAGARPSDDLWLSASPADEAGELPDGYSWVGDEMQCDWEPERSYSHVCEFEGALDQLLACSLRRRQWDGRIRPVSSGTE